jgi:hypothetical protein
MSAMSSVALAASPVISDVPEPMTFLLLGGGLLLLGLLGKRFLRR